MVSDHPSSQRIARLAPLADVLAWIDANVRAVAPREVSVADATGRTLAADIKVTQAIPSKAIALRDGYALQSVWTSDASSYAPAPLPQMPARVDVGDALPAGTDCVAALDHVAIKGERAEALAVVAPGEGILPAGGDAAANQTLLGAGKKLSASDVALLRIASISKVSIRAPRVCVVQTRTDDAIIASAAQMIAAAINKNGGAVVSEEAETRTRSFRSAARAPDKKTRRSPHWRAPAKSLFMASDSHREKPPRSAKRTANRCCSCPAASMPRWPAGWCSDERMFARLAGGTMDNVTTPLKLTRKITSTIGIADVVLLKRNGGDAEPLASGYWPIAGLGAGRLLLCGAAGERRFPGRRDDQCECAAMSAKDKAESDLLAAIRNAARQEQFLEVVSPEEAQKRFAAHLDLSPFPAESVALDAALGRALGA